jgi:hypothetical protein
VITVVIDFRIREGRHSAPFTPPESPLLPSH